MAGADGNAHFVQQKGQILVVGAFHRYGKEGYFLLRSTWNAVEFNPGIICQSIQNIINYCGLLCRDFLTVSALVYKLNCGNKRRNCVQVLGAGFKFGGRFGIGGAGETYGFYHLPSAHIRRHSVQPFLLSVKDTGAGCSIKFVPGEGVKVAVDIPNVHLLMNNSLRSVN